MEGNKRNFMSKIGGTEKVCSCYQLQNRKVITKGTKLLQVHCVIRDPMPPHSHSLLMCILTVHSIYRPHHASSAEFLIPTSASKSVYFPHVLYLE